MAELWARSRWSASARNGCNSLIRRRLMNALRSSANSRILTEAETERLTLRGETFAVAWSALLISLFALSYSHSRGLMLLYGDAVAHLNCARKVIDSLHPGLSQLGTVWLPL